MPTPLHLSINRNPKGYIYTDEDGEIGLSWQMNNDATSEVVIEKNNVPFKTLPNAGTSSGFIPEPLDEHLVDVYTVTVIALNEYGDEIRDIITYEVYNARSLNVYFDNITGGDDYKLDNNQIISGMSSEAIIDLKRKIELTAMTGVDMSKYDWQWYDSME